MLADEGYRPLPGTSFRISGARNRTPARGHTKEEISVYDERGRPSPISYIYLFCVEETGIHMYEYQQRLDIIVINNDCL
jgi:hypothetical protein